MKPDTCPKCGGNNIIVVPNGNRFGCGDCATMIEPVPEGDVCQQCGSIARMVIIGNVGTCQVCGATKVRE